MILVFGADYATDSTHGILPASPFKISSTCYFTTKGPGLEDSTPDVLVGWVLRVAERLIRLLQKRQAARSKAIPEPDALNTEPRIGKPS